MPQEGPCECDLDLTCAMFATTREHAARPRARWRREQELAADAAGLVAPAFDADGKKRPVLNHGPGTVEVTAAR